MLRRHAALTSLACTAALTLAAPAGAAVVTGSVNPLDDFHEYTLEEADGEPGAPATATADWVVYGGYNDAADPIDPTDHTTKLQSSSFSPITIVSGNAFATNRNGRIKLIHNGGYGDFPAATSTYGNRDVSAPVPESGTLSSLSFEHTLLGGDEDLTIYLFAKQANQLSVDISAVLDSGGDFTATDLVLPTQITSGGGQGDYGILNLSVRGGAAGDVLTFTLSSDYSAEIAGGLTPQNYWGVGIAAATVTVIPEPASLALLGLGGLAVLGRRRR